MLHQIGLVTIYAGEPEESAVGTAAEPYRYKIEWTNGYRMFRVQAEMDQAFGKSIADRLFAIIGNVVLQRMVFGNADRFIRRAQSVGLTRRRPHTRPFRPPLPYQTPDPTSLRERIVQEAGLIEAAVSFALTARGPEPGRRLVIRSYSKAPNGNRWSLGSAPVNSYPDDGYLRMSLNRRALADAGLSNDRWGAIIAHEILHNLGWGHGEDDYRRSNAIEIYEACIERRVAALPAEEGDHTEMDQH